jgi:hypothetical protein
MGFSDRTVGAVVLIAHHSRQPLDRVAGRVRSGESPRSVAAGLGLDGGALLATADALIPGLPPAAGDGIVRPPISPVRERVAGVRLEQRRRESRRRARGSIR